MGTAATGRVYRYRYYTCLGRQQHGRRHGCDAPHIAADRAEQQALEPLLAVFRDTGLVPAGLAKAAAEREASRPRIAEQLTSLRAEISQPRT